MKTIIKTILIVAIFGITTTIQAQNPLTFGVKAGINLTDFAGDMEDNKMKVGFNAGVTVDYRLNKNFYILSGLEVNSKGTKVDGIIYGTNMSGKIKQTFNPIYLQVPLHAGYILHLPEGMQLLFHAGPYVAYGIAGKVSGDIYIDMKHDKIKENLFGSSNIFKRWDLGLGLGAGFEIYKIGVNLGYDLGLLNASTGMSMKNNAAHISFSYRFQQ